MIEVSLPIQLNCDSQSAISIAKYPVLHEHMKHVELDSHFVRDLVTDEFITISYVPTQLQIADLLTKPKSSQFMPPFLAKMNLLALKDVSARGGNVNIRADS